MEYYDPKKRYCGPGKGIIAWLVPEKPLGVCINHCCWIHDGMYKLGGTGQDRLKADEVFRSAIVFQFKARRRWLPEFIGRWIAERYFKAVRILGSACFNYRAVPDPRFVKLVEAAKVMEAMLKTGQPCEARRNLSYDEGGAILAYRFAIRAAEAALAEAGETGDSDDD